MHYKCLICRTKSFTIPDNPKVWEVAVIQNKMAWHIQDEHPTLPSWSRETQIPEEE